MNVKSNLISNPVKQREPRAAKTLTLRLPAGVHENIKEAAKLNSQTLNQFIGEAASDAAKIALGEGAQGRADLAIFIDLDSFSGRPSINIDALERVAARLGRPLVRYSFSSVGSLDLDSSRQAVLRRHYRHEELPSREALRMRIAIESLDLAAKGDIEEIIIVTGDEEFGFVSSILESRGAKVTGVGVRTDAETSPDFIRAFESFRFYDQVDRPPESDQLMQLRERYVNCLIQAAYTLENRGAKPVGAALIPLIKDRYPEASPELLELRNWRELAGFAHDQDLVEHVEPSGTDFLLKLTDRGRDLATAQLEDTEAESAQFGAIELIRSAIASILSIELPDVRSRFLIFNTVQWVVNEEITRDGMSLVDLSYRVAAHLDSTGVPQNTVYRLLYGLYRGGAFDFTANDTNENDPCILRARIPSLLFDDAFVLNLMHIRKKFPLSSKPADISEVIYGSPLKEDKVRSLLSLAADPDVDRTSLPRHLAKLESASNTS